MVLVQGVTRERGFQPLEVPDSTNEGCSAVIPDRQPGNRRLNTPQLQNSTETIFREAIAST
jgi:hypothetical protein